MLTTLLLLTALLGAAHPINNWQVLPLASALTNATKIPSFDLEDNILEVKLTQLHPPYFLRVKLKVSLLSVNVDIGFTR